jgi:hypothetical protein
VAGADGAALSVLLLEQVRLTCATWQAYSY